MAILTPPRSRPAGRYGFRDRSRLDAAPVRHFDYLLIGAALGICALGLAMVYSTTDHLVHGDAFYYLKRQTLFLGIGVAVMLGVMAVDYRKLRDFSMLFYGATVFVLFAVLAPLGTNVKGHQAWFQLPGGFTVQPSELAKFGIIIALAGYLNEHKGELDAWRLTVIVALAGIPIGLVLLQPDLGTVMVFALIIVALLAMAGATGKQLIVLALLAITGVYAIVNLGVLKQYQLERLTTF